MRIWSHLLKKSSMENFIFCGKNCSRALSNHPLEQMHWNISVVRGIFLTVPGNVGQVETGN